jgi:membrane fusion protein (multidrug efflux system)
MPVTEEQHVDETEGKPKKSKRARRYIIVVFILIIVAVIVFGYWYFFLRGVVSTDDAFIDANPVTVSSKIPGRIVMLAADDGDSVSQGELLVQLDDSDLLAQKARAEATLHYVKANVPLAKVNLDKAQDDYNRAQIQFKGGVITQERFDHASKALEAAKAQYEIAQDQVKSSQAELTVIETQLQNTRIQAPSPGVVAKKWVMPGDVVQPAQPIYTIYNLRDVWITANFEETKIRKIALGDSVSISVDAYPGRKFAGKVILFGAAAASQFSLIPPNNASGNFTKVTQRVPVRISLDSLPAAHSSGPSLLPGMSVTVKIRPGTR